MPCKTFGRLRLPQFVSLLFLVLACFALPQQAAAQTLPTLDLAAVMDAGEDGQTLVVFQVDLDTAQTEDVTLSWNVTGGTATAADFNVNYRATGMVTIPDGERAARIQFRVVDDVEVEGTETLELTISSPPEGVQIGTATATAMITDDDNATPTVSLRSVRDVTEGAQQLIFRIDLNTDLAEDITLTWTVSGSSTTTAADFDEEYAATGMATITSGRRTVPIQFRPVIDTLTEGDETLELTISSPPAGVQIGTATASAMISDSDAAGVNIANATVDEDDADGSVDFTVSLTKAVDSDLVFDVIYRARTDNPVTLADDLGTDRQTMVTIAEGETVATITVPVTNDPIVEGDETFLVVIRERMAAPLPEGVIIDDGSALGTIVDDDTAVVTLSPSAPEMIEGGTFSYIVSLSAAADEAVDITWTASIESDNNDNASLADDVDTPHTGTVSFTAGTNADQTFTIATTEDTVMESDETFTVTLTPTSTLPTGVDIHATDGSSVATIVDNDTPTVSLAAVREVSENANNLIFRVDLTRARTEDVTLSWSVSSDSTASADDFDEDYAATGMVTIPSGQTAARILFGLVDDVLAEGTETLILTISNPPSGVTIRTATATGMIIDDDAASPTVNLRAVGDVTEGDPHLTFRVDLNTDLADDITLSWRVSGGTASAADFNEDYTDSGTVTIGSGRRTIPIRFVPIIDSAMEGDETLVLTISNPPSGVTIGTATATGTISNNDATGVSIADAASVAENGGNVDFAVSLSRAVVGDLVLDVIYEGGTDNPATPTRDLGAGRPTTVTIRDGETRATITVPINNDGVVEGDETFRVIIRERMANPLPEGVIIDDGSAIGTIVDNETAEVTLSPAEATAAENGTFTYTVSLSRTAEDAVTVRWTATAESGDTATVADDLREQTGTVTFPIRNNTAQEFTIRPVDDPDDEDNETFTVTLGQDTQGSNPNPLPPGVTIGTNNSSTATITDNDMAAAGAPAITTQPVNQSVTVGDSATFTVVASGTPTPTYQWRKDGTAIPGATSATYTISSTASTDAGSYTVVVTNTAGAVTSTAATLTVTPAAVAPAITTQPVNQSVTVGGSATFTVVATGTPTPTYQWRKDGTAIPGATSATYTISSAALTDEGSYTVVVTNTAGAVTSTAATLTVTAATVAPAITTQPTNQSVTVGGSATFTVVATGTPTPTYQWRKDGTAIPGATSATYTISSAALTDAGSYTVVVTNTAGAVTSTAATLEVTPAAVAPAITTQPVNQSVTVGDAATFTVVATGTPTPTYQWRKDGTAISGATSATYTISSAALTDEGSYTVVVTNTAGTVTSTAATLTVMGIAPAITTQPVNQSATVGDSATFTVAATGTPTPTYQWRKDGTAIPGATSATYTISNAALTDEGSYTVVVTNTAGAVTSTAATLTVTAAPAITTQPTNQSVTVGGSATFTVAATGTPTPTYQWRKDGTAIPGATSATYTISNAALTDEGSYTVVVTNTAGAVTSTAATLTVTAVAPEITTQPTNQSVTVGDSATFTVVASGAPTPTYQWRRDGTDIAGATSATYTLASAALVNAGAYTVVVTNSAGTVTSTAATLTVTAAPAITTQPTNQSVTVGDSATFTVAASGTPTPTYQWRRDGTDIAGATSATYTLASAAVADAGSYTVVVTNTAGTVTSTAATLTVTAAPEITTQPVNQSVTVGDDAAFTVVASGAPTPTYQWRRDGTAIPGATSATYAISSAALTDAGSYTVVVTNTAGTVTSTAATLTVTPTAPDLTVDSVSVSSASVVEGASFTINATVNNEGNAASAATTLTYYRSTDATITTDDTSIATDPIGILAASGSSTQNASVSIATADIYYVGACVPTVSGETNTNNNCSTGVQVTVTAAAVAPAITTQPVNQSVTVGGSATFAVVASGTPTPTYQWRKDGTAIAGATSATYTISSTALTDAGSYTVVVTNTAGNVTSTAATLTVTPAAVAPAITTQPTDQSVTVGDSATFTVVASGAPTPTYQWRKDGTAISGATSATYTLAGATEADAGSYTVVVTNTAGNVTSTAATLTVTAAAVAPAITTQPTNQSVTVGDAATFAVVASGTSLNYQWRKDGTDIAGATSATYTISGAAEADAGSYTVVVTNSVGTVTSTAATLTVTAVAPEITTQPTNQSVTVGDSATFTVVASGAPTPTYQWRRDGTDIAGATSATYTLASAALVNAGAYTVVVTNSAGTVTSTAATLTVTAAPAITTQPTNQSVTVGDSATFTVAASGTPTPTYQWRRDGTDIAGATSATYTLASAAVADAGSYTVVVTNTAGTVTSTAATLTVTAAPAITTQPVNQSVTVGDDAAFTVVASGTPTPTYQWRRDGTAIPGATSATYAISSAALTDAGSYTVVVTNTAGTVTSTAATLTVTPTAPDLTVDSVSVSSASVVEGASFTINATVNNEGNAASAATTLTYYRSTDATITTDDTSIATDPIGILAASGSSTQNASVSIATADIYYVGACVPTVSGETNTNNNCSTGVQVTVTAAAVAPAITTQPVNQSVTVGGSATFTVVASGTPTPTYQWRKDGTAIAGATSATYTISSTALTDAGSYTVVVTNTAGNVTSTAATLTVTPAAVAPAITTQPTDQSVTVGDSATFTVVASGAPTPTYQWRKDGTAISGATSATYTLAGATEADAGSYTVVVTNTAGNVTSTAATLTVTAVVNATVSIGNASVAENDGNAEFTVSLTQAVTEDVTLAVAYTAGTATLATDLGARPDTVTIDLGQTSATLLVPITNDNIVEGNEDFTVTISEGSTALPEGVTIGTGATGTGTITDNDTAEVTLGPATLEAAENGTFTYTVSLSAPADAAVTVRWTATDGTATVATDLQATTNTVTFPANDNTAQEFTISPVDDPDDEGNETFTVTLEVDTEGGNPLPTGVTIGTNNSSTATITDNDTASSDPTVSIAARTVAENVSGGVAVFTATLSAVQVTGTVLNVAVTAGGGTNPVTLADDLGTLSTLPTTVRIEQGDLSNTFTVPITNDEIVEGDETFTVTITENDLPLGLTIGTGVVTGTITDDDMGEVTLSPPTLTAAENGTFEYTVSLDNAADEAVNVTWTASAESGDTATVADDLQAPITGEVTFLATEKDDQTFTITVNDDMDDEENETFTVTLSATGTLPTGVTIPSATSSSKATITDNDGSAGATVNIADATGGEDMAGGAAAFIVSLTSAVNGDVTLAVTYAAGSTDPATPADDLGAGRPPTVTINQGETRATLSVPIFDDNIVEGEETFTVTIREDPANRLPADVTIGDNQATGTITDNDSSKVSLGSASAQEGTTVILMVNLTNPLAADLTLGWTATVADPSQGESRSGTVMVKAGDTSAMFRIDTTGLTPGAALTVRLDGADLPLNVELDDERNMASPRVPEVGPVDARVRIADADPVKEGAGPARFTISLSQPVGSDVILDVAYTAGSAALEDLGSPRPATVTIGADTTETVLDVPIIDDDIVEGAETFTVTLALNTAPDGLILADGRATGTIARTPEPSVLIEPRRIGAGTALRRHAGRFDSLTGTLVRDRLKGSGTHDLSLSAEVTGDSQDVTVSSRPFQDRWGAWIDGAWVSFDGNATGRQADIHGGVDYLSADGDWLIGALIGYELADLDIGEATFRSDYLQFGIYGGTILTEQLVFDGALSFGLATPDVALGDVSASYDAHRFTMRGALTGDFGFEHGLGTGSVRIEPQVGLLYSRETLDAFTDSVGREAEREVLELGRLSAGPRLTWAFDGGQVTGGARMQWDFVGLDDGVGGRLSGAADIGLKFDLTPDVSLGVRGDVDGIGIGEDFRSVGGKVELEVRF